VRVHTLAPLSTGGRGVGGEGSTVVAEINIIRISFTFVVQFLTWVILIDEFVLTITHEHLVRTDLVPDRREGVDADGREQVVIQVQVFQVTNVRVIRQQFGPIVGDVAPAQV
jgi:hypothetical protein